MNALHSAREQLEDAWNMLNSQWRITQDLWRDSVCDDFAKYNWDEIDNGMKNTLKEFQELLEVLDDARRRID